MVGTIEVGNGVILGHMPTVASLDFVAFEKDWTKFWASSLAEKKWLSFLDKSSNL